jgi:hypothetical protein
MESTIKCHISNEATSVKNISWDRDIHGELIHGNFYLTLSQNGNKLIETVVGMDIGRGSPKWRIEKTTLLRVE